MKFVAAIAQIDSAIGDLNKNLRKHVEFIRRAREGGADLVVFPELSLSGYSVRDSNWDVALRPGENKVLGEILRESKDISIVLGGVEESSEFGIYNSSFFIEEGKVLAIHRKVYPPTYGMFEEGRYFSSGKTARAFMSRLGRLGMLVCEDLWHLSLPYVLAQDGAQVVVGISASPTRLSGESSRPAIAQVNTEQHKAYARLLSCYVVFCNRVGYEDGVNFWGGSEVIAPDGEVLVQAKLFEEEIVFAEIDGEEVRRARRLSRHFIDEDLRLTIEELRLIQQRRESEPGNSSL